MTQFSTHVHPAIHFYDAATPENVPSGVHAAVYVNGFAWPQSQIDRMEKVIRISVHREAFWARHARCIDVESHAALPQDVPEFVRERRQFTHAHGLADDATVYVNRSNWDEVARLVHDSGQHPPLWWVATLDGTQDVGSNAWAVQYENVRGAFDLSVLHGVDNFHKP